MGGRKDENLVEKHRKLENAIKPTFRFEAVTLSLHEGNPGHNYQFVFNKQQKDVPRFMANPMFHR